MSTLLHQTGTCSFQVSATDWCKRARRVFVNLEGTERIYTKGAGPMCPRDGYVLFRNSELLCGRLGKQTLGGGNKASLFQARAQGVVQRSQ